MTGREKGLRKLKKCKWLYDEYHDNNERFSEKRSMELFQDERCTTSNDYYMNGISSAYNDYRESYSY